MYTDKQITSLLEISRLVAQHGITTYDATYLELAMRLACPLATQGKALAKAARKCGVNYSAG